MSYKAHMHGGGESHSGVVPAKQPNKSGRPPAEVVEERPLTKENMDQLNLYRIQSRESGPNGLDRVREAARRDGKLRFTALLHHVTVDLLWDSYHSLKKRAAPGVDGVTWEEYGQDLEARLRDLHGRIHRGAYRAKPSRRVWILKDDGRQRPLGIAALEDKVVQYAVGTVLNQIWEEDFLGFSYGFRPGRSQHDALDALYVGITRKKVSWVLDLDIRAFFDQIEHSWMIKFVEHRIGDRRIVRLIQKWLKAGVMEQGRWDETKEGTPQGAVISPLLANLYLHYVLDLWVDQWRRKEATGGMIIVRYADDAVLGFQHQKEAERFLVQLRERLGKFGLELHPEKTRLIEFGRYGRRAPEETWQRKTGDLQLFGFHSHLWDEPEGGPLHNQARDHREAHGGQAERNQGEAETAHARVHRGHPEVVAVCGEGVFPISRRTGQRASTEGVPERCAADMAAPASATESTEPLDLGTFLRATGCPTSCRPDRTSQSRRALRRQTSKVRTVCTSGASTGLCGGYRATGIPTATHI